jgi:hypothetical protein
MTDELSMSEMDGLMGDLAAVQTSHRGPIEVHAEFRKVFLGSDMGKRVLYDILGWCHVWRSSIVAVNPHMTYAYEGQRALALRILKALHVQPTARPDKQRRQAKE